MSFKQCISAELQKKTTTVFTHTTISLCHTLNTKSGKYMIYFLLISNPVDSGYDDILLYAKYSIRPLVYHIAGCATREISAQMYQKVDINDAHDFKKSFEKKVFL